MRETIGECVQCGLAATLDCDGLCLFCDLNRCGSGPTSDYWQVERGEKQGYNDYMAERWARDREFEDTYPDLVRHLTNPRGGFL